MIFDVSARSSFDICLQVPLWSIASLLLDFQPNSYEPALTSPQYIVGLIFTGLLGQ